MRRAEIRCELSGIELADNDSAESGEHLLSISRQRTDEVEMCEADLPALIPELLECTENVAVSSTPADNENVA